MCDDRFNAASLLRRHFAFLIFGLLTLFSCSMLHTPVLAQTYDVALDYSLNNNPNGVWSYGYSTTLNSTFNLYNTSEIIPYIEGSTSINLSAWKTDFDPNLGVFQNAIGQPFNGPNTSYAEGELALHPGQHNEYSKIVWTAPITGWYQMQAAFRLNSTGQTDAHLFVKGIEVVNSLLTSKGDTASYTFNGQRFIAGDTIVFAVGDGGNGYGFDTTGLEAHIRPIQIPSDFNGDGQPDFVWQDQLTGDVSVWYMHGAQWTGEWDYLGRNIPTQWKIVGTSDLNGDSKPDILWQNGVTGDVSVWYMNGASWTGQWSYVARNVPLEWKIAGTPDLNSNGLPDLLWQNTSTGDVTVWYMDGATWPGTWDYIAHSVPIEWKVAVSQ